MMKNATAISMRIEFLIAAALAFAAQPLLAQSEDPVSKRDPDVGNVVSTPADDLNLSSEDIPEVLQRAVIDAYDRQGLESCERIGAEIAELDAVLGLDFDSFTGGQRRLSAGRLAKSAVGTLIPFRGIVRELSGAAKNEREFSEAVMAGAVRRGYLKGMGEKMGCPYPARPIDPATRAANAAAAAAEAAAKEAEDGDGDRD